MACSTGQQHSSDIIFSFFSDEVDREPQQAPASPSKNTDLGDDADDEYEQSLSESIKPKTATQEQVNSSKQSVTGLEKECENSTSSKSISSETSEKYDTVIVDKTNDNAASETNEQIPEAVDLTDTPEDKENRDVESKQKRRTHSSTSEAQEGQRQRSATMENGRRKKKISIGQKTKQLNTKSASFENDTPKAETQAAQEDFKLQDPEVINVRRTESTENKGIEKKHKLVGQESTEGKENTKMKENDSAIMKDVNVDVSSLEKQKQTKQNATVMATILKSIVSEKNVDSDNSAKEKRDATNIKKSIPASKPSLKHTRRNVGKKFSLSDVTESQQYSSEGVPRYDTPVASERNPVITGISGEKSRKGKLIKTQSAMKFNVQDTRDTSEEGYYRESRYEASRRSSRIKYFDKRSGSSSSTSVESDSRRAMSKSFSTASRPNTQQFIRKKMRQSLEGRPTVTREDSDVRANVKPIKAFQDDSHA